jgi:hypothetical protein
MKSTRVLRDPFVLGAVALGLGLRLVRLGDAPLWFDEVITAEWVARPWAEMLRLCLADNHPPLYFLIAKWVHGILGEGAWALRLPSALFGAATVPLVAAAAAVLTSDERALRAARFGAVFAALSPFLVHHAQEARMYGLVGMLAAANALALARFAAGHTARLGALFAASAVALAATHYYSVFYVGGAVLGAAACRPRPVRAWLPSATVSLAAAGGALLSAWLLARHQAGGSYAFGAFAVPGALWSLVAGYTFLPDTFELHAAGGRAALRYLPVALAAGPVLACCALLALRGLARELWPALLLPLATTWLAPFAIRLVLGVGVNPRYFQASVPALLVLLAVGAASRGWSRLPAPAVGVALGALLVAGTARHLADPGHGREDVRAAGAWLEANLKPGERVIVTSREMAYLARFHWSPREIVEYPPPGTTVDASAAERVARELPWGEDRAVYAFGRAWVSDPSGALEAAVRAYPSCGGIEVRGVRVYCLRQGTSAEPR